MSNSNKVTMATDGKIKILEVCPTVEDLSSDMKKNVDCPVPGCGKTFNHDNALRMHVVKTHQIFQDEKDNEFFHKFKHKSENPPCSYHCPMEGCKYQKGAAKHFSSYKTLKQHFRVVHKEKKFACETCGIKFSIDSHLNRHKMTCGLIFKCCTCGCPYTTREAVLTHCRRKQHLAPERPTMSEWTRPAPDLVKDSNEKMEFAIPSVTICPLQTFKQENCIVSDGQLMASIDTQTQECTERTEQCSDRGMNMTKTTETQCGGTIGSLSVDTGQSYTGASLDNDLNSSPLALASSLGVSFNKKKESAKGSKTTSASSDPHVVNIFVFNVNSGSDGVPTVKSIIDQTSQPIAQSRPVCILPKASPSCPGTVNQGRQNQYKTLNDGSGITKTSSVVQTSDFPIVRTTTETQTTGDYVLMKAMQSANIPIQKESRGAQVSPRAKLGGVKRTIPTQTTSVQTGTETRPVVRRKRRKKLPKGSEAATAGTSTSFSPVTSPHYSVPDLLDFGFSDSETQTIAMIEELEASLAASTSTQTRESFLANPNTWQDTSQPPLHMQTIETQTLKCGSSEGFSLLNFLNSGDNSNDNRSSGVQTPSITQMPSFDQSIQLTGSDLSLELPHPHQQPMMDVLNPGGPLFDASAQTTEISTAIQTQTIDTMFSQLLSNMETQTSDDLPLLELGLMDNQTQTPFDLDVMGSQTNVQTQTSLHVSTVNSSHVQSTDIETQTLFPNLSSTDSHTQTSLADLEKFMNF